MNINIYTQQNNGFPIGASLSQANTEPLRTSVVTQIQYEEPRDKGLLDHIRYHIESLVEQIQDFYDKKELPQKKPASPSPKTRPDASPF